ncbi:MAG TPA: toll/interleukin-1 receptor domain-containing protein [Longimicrobiaceae bacterium]|jgi:hypothetical protein|nr:toll/interleukin-1 receptor domain-containing protein [Longimicrobiaceae bacterium]
MKVFISWSGPRSFKVAEKLREWLPDVLQEVDPWLSKADIDAGARWARELESQLAETQYGILCLTRENQTAPWILFEAGALAKSVQDAFVCPYLIGFPPTELSPGPLTQFQAKSATRDETWELVQSINRALKEKALTPERLKRSFEKFWPDLEALLCSLPEEADAVVPRRSSDEMVAEILSIVRTLAREEPNPLGSDEPAQRGAALNWLLLREQLDAPVWPPKTAMALRDLLKIMPKDIPRSDTDSEEQSIQDG